MTVRAISAILVTAAAAQGAAAGGDDDEPENERRPAEGPAVSIEDARQSAAERFAERPAGQPNLLGGDRPIARLLPILDQDITAFYAETLAARGASITAPEIRREAGPCDGEQVEATDPPRYCRGERLVFEPEAGSDKVRDDRDPAALYVLVGWAHAQATGAALGWEDEVAAGRYTRAQVAESDFCLLFAWIDYTIYQGLFEESDYPTIERMLDGDPVFAEVPAEVRERAISKGRIGADICIA